MSEAQANPTTTTPSSENGNVDVGGATVFTPTVDALAASTEGLSLGSSEASRARSLNPLLNPQYTSDIPFTHPEMAGSIPRPILEALTMDLQFVYPSAVQRKAIPKVHDRKNLIIQSQTGTGKTICFTIGMLSCIDTRFKDLQSLCLAPTRELARQIFKDAIEPLKKRMDPTLVCELVIPDEAGKIKSKPITAHLVVGTPGTIKTLVEKRFLVLDKLKVFVLDEADNMIGYKDSRGDKLGQHVKFVRDKLTSNPQMLLFSATFSDEALKFADSIVRDKGRKSKDGETRVTLITPPQKINPNDPNSRADPLANLPLFQVMIDCGSFGNETDKTNAKINVMSEIITCFGTSIEKCIIFVKSHKTAEVVANHFSQLSYVSKFHGHMNTSQRDEMFDRFCNGDVKFLVATDVLAKGIDVPATSHVINVDVPDDFETNTGDHIYYTHKIGRCIRFGRFGAVINLLSGEEDMRKYKEIEHMLGYTPDSGRSLSTIWDKDNVSSLKEEFQRRKLEHESRGVMEAAEEERKL